MHDIGVDQLRRHSLWLSRLTLFLLVATALIIILPTLIIFGRMFAADGQISERAGLATLHWVPSIFYLYALWAIRSAFRDFAVGGVFGPAIAEGCARAGLALAIGATLSAVGIPNLMRLIRGGSGSILHLDVAYLAVGVVGLALLLLGRLLRRAADLQREAAALRSELSEFF